ncbi:hypothetical protein CHCC15087_0304 [Bacillus licheniformis]|nr:hypothetical protein CHCC15087_0304 [Bacillus licheniformis]
MIKICNLWVYYSYFLFSLFHVKTAAFIKIKTIILKEVKVC